MTFIDQKKDIDRSSTLYSIKTLFELFHAVIANIKFLSKSTVDPHYCLLSVDFFSSKIYTHPMKKRSLLAKKMEPFYEEIETKRDSKEQKDSNRFGIQTKGDSKVKLKIQSFNVSY